ncbi:autotransporter outer membrane beta-barrel domain-containing protein, partial [Campylobacter sp. S4:11]|uniref:autotransporter outer membrane beta-barrel domain-containing protein n=1 Tax=Campylobacter sp. S4:11 TaxID=2735745 RepID=UPI00301C7831|nr:autotransporter outer membrane beta-barrel domain-containing protein [Campylobacter sp. S4:11]
IKDYIKLEGSNALIAGGTAGIYNKGTIGVNNNGTSVNNGNVIDLQDGAIIAALTPNQDGSFSYNLAGDAILNEGTIKGNINLNNKANIYGAINNKNTITGNISLNNNSYASSIKNEKEIQGSIDLKDKSHIDSVINNGTIEKGINLDDSSISLVENSSSLDLNLKNHSEVGFLKNSGTITIDQDNTSNIASVDNTGNISGTITNNSNMIYVINKNTMENIVNKASLTKDESQTISQIINEGEKAHIKTIENQTQSSIGIIMNTGKVDSIINEGSISSAIGNGGFINDINNKANANIAHIKNEGTIDKIDNSGTIDKINNYIHGIINTINNQENANINIANQGEIKNGITNSGNMILSNLPSDYGAKSFIGKNNNGYHLENNNGGKLNIDGWYFNAPEYTTKEDRLQNSIIIGGNNLGGINADSIYINNKDIQQNIVYDANTFFINKEGESIGDKTNNNLGVDGNNIIDPTGIFNFVGVGNGGYMAHVDLDEVSGKTLAKSMVYSARLRNINISNILRDLNTKNFQTEFSQVLDMELSKKGEAYGNDADLLAELEDIFIPNKNPNAKNHTFLLPYYNHSSIKIGKSVGSLSSNTTGLIGGSFRELPNDYGTIGFYLGYEDASKEQATQRLKLDDKTYYGGLTYYGVLARDGINQYYISASTRLDYTKTDIEKTYKNNTATIDSDAKTYGYGVDVKVGANYYNTLDIARISPEIGLSYYGMSNKNFTLKHLGGLKEHYNGEQFNFIDASAALKWYKPWSDKIRSNITIGAIVNLYNDAQGSLKLGQNYFTTQIETSKYYGFGQLGLSYAIADNADLSLNYAGAFTFDNTTSHTMFLKLGLWW